MQEVLLVTIVEAVQQLSHDARVVHLVEFDHSRLEQAHEIVVHVLEDQIEGPFILKQKKFPMTLQKSEKWNSF